MAAVGAMRREAAAAEAELRSLLAPAPAAKDPTQGDPARLPCELCHAHVAVSAFAAHLRDHGGKCACNIAGGFWGGAFLQLIMFYICTSHGRLKFARFINYCT